MADLGAIAGNATVGSAGGGTASGGTSGISSAIKIVLMDATDLGVVASLDSVIPEFTFRPTTCHQLNKHRVNGGVFGDGYEQRQTDGLNSDLLEYDLTFENVQQDEGDAIEEFLIARAALEAFFWTPPRKDQIKVVCTEPYTREWNPDVEGESTISCKFRQVFEL